VHKVALPFRFPNIDAVNQGLGDLQLAHLLEIAKHEQANILQRHIYDDAEFSNWIQLQRAPYVKWASAQLELVSFWQNGLD
jgi:hypothetical protein